MCPTHPTGKEGTYSKLPCDKGFVCLTSKGDQTSLGLVAFFLLPPSPGEYSTNVYTHPVVQHLTLLYTFFFLRKRFPFRISSIDKWHPFHIYCLELCIPFDCRKCTVFSIEINLKNRTFSRLCKANLFMY